MKFIILILSLFLFSVSSYSQNNNKSDVEFTSDSLEVDENKNLMIAKGNVVIKSEKEIIKADIVKYDKSLDKATASGNISIVSNDGTIIETSEIILTNEFKDILALTLFTKFKDNSKLKATRLSKISNKSVFLRINDLFCSSRPSRVVPQIKEIYPGTNGKTQGDKKLTAPAKKDIK